MNEYKVTARKSGGAIIGTLIRGDNGTAAVRVVIPRYANGVDLAPLVWSVHIANASGAADVVIPAAVTADDASVMFAWLPGGVATAAAGMTEVHFEGVGEGALVWASATYHLRIDDKVDTTPSGEDAQKLTELQQLIVFVSGELNGVIEAGRAAQEAANRANDAAERAENIAGLTIDGTLTQPGAAADAAVVGGKFNKLSEEMVKTVPQELTEEQKSQVRANIGAIGGENKTVSGDVVQVDSGEIVSYRINIDPNTTGVRDVYLHTRGKNMVNFFAEAASGYDTLYEGYEKKRQRHYSQGTGRTFGCYWYEYQ